MSFAVGIIGLPNVGKTTLFKALTGQEVKIAPRPFTTIHPNIGLVQVPDKRLKKLSQLIRPEKTTPARIKFFDIAGLVKGAHQGEGLGNQFLSQIRPCEVLIEVVRAFEDPQVKHLAGAIDPERDIEIIKLELIMKDLEGCEKQINKAKKKGEGKRLALLKKIEQALSEEKMIKELQLSDEEQELIKEFQFLTQKPIILLFNTDDGLEQKQAPASDRLIMNLKLEEEMFELEEQERKELKLKSRLNQVILSCYKALNLITFFTIAGGEEAKAWPLRSGSTAVKAGGVVHSDFEKKFIRAQVLPWPDLIAAQGWRPAQEKGLIKVVGKDYQVQDGDIIEFKI